MPSKPSRLDAGKLDRLVTLQQRQSTDTPDSTSGEPVDTWTTLSASPAQKIDATGDERFNSDMVRAHYDTIWRIPYQAGMDPDLVDVPKLRRVVYQSRAYDIVSASEIGRRNGIELETLSGTAV